MLGHDKALYRSRLKSAGVKIKGLNVVHGMRDGDVPNFPSLWTYWPWERLIKPEMDAALALGANCLKVCCAGIPGENGVTYPSDSVLLGRIRQFCGYAQTRGAWVYWNFPSANNWATNQTSANNGIPAMQKVAGWLETIPNVIGLDICNEFNNASMWGGGDLSTFPNMMGQLAAAVRSVSSLPITTSVDVTSSAAFVGNFMSAAASIVDYHDFHPYYGSGDPAVIDVNALRQASWYKGYFLIGEIGQTLESGAAAQTARLNAVAAIVNGYADNCGAVAFSVSDYDPTAGNTWGFYDRYVTLSAPRTGLTTPFQAWSGSLR